MADKDRFTKEMFQQMVLPEPQPYKSMIDRQMRDIEIAAIHEFVAKNGDKPFACGWTQGTPDDPYMMTFSVVEIPTVEIQRM